MHLPTIEMDREEAQARADAYKVIQTPSDEERGIVAGYLALAAGKPVRRSGLLGAG